MTCRRGSFLPRFACLDVRRRPVRSLRLFSSTALVARPVAVRETDNVCSSRTVGGEYWSFNLLGSWYRVLPVVSLIMRALKIADTLVR